jgi:hypothetical protein
MADLTQPLSRITLRTRIVTEFLTLTNCYRSAGIAVNAAAIGDSGGLAR